MPMQPCENVRRSKIKHEAREDHEEVNLHRDNAAELVLRFIRFVVNAVMRFRQDLREIDDIIFRR